MCVKCIIVTCSCRNFSVKLTLYWR